jgi:hypothetical protein
MDIEIFFKQNKVQQIHSSLNTLGSLSTLDWEPKVNGSIRDGDENFLIQSRLSLLKLPESGEKTYKFSTGL